MISSIAVFLLGAALAAFANYCADALGWTPRYRSPWRRFPKEIREKSGAPARALVDYVPILGGIFAARLGGAAQEEAGKRGKRATDKSSAPERVAIPGLESAFFWVRPFFVEFLFALLIAWRFEYWRASGTLELWFWAIETLLFWLMLSASLIDLDDQIIPDALTIPGAALGLIASALCPQWLAPVVYPLDWTGERATESVREFAANFATANGWSAFSSSPRALVALALACAWTFWCFALLDRRFYLRFGIRKASAIFCRAIRRSPLTPIVAGLWALGLVGIGLVAWRFGGAEDSVEALLRDPLEPLARSFLGLTVGLVLVWAVRLVGSFALGVEAMGFGDVILSGVIGSFIGWQGIVVVFFIAPFFGLVFGVIRRCFNSSRHIPYGPFICLGALTWIIWSHKFDAFLTPYFGDPVFALGIGLVGFVLLAVMLLLLRLVKSLAR